MSLTFYYGSGSPYAWRVWLALEHKRIPYELQVLSFSAGDLKKPEYLAVNPRHRVPAIVDDGFALYESAAILEYLDERHGGEPRLFPGDVRQRALARRMVREADQYFAEALEVLVDNILFTPQEQWAEAPIAKARAALREELALWETLIAGDYLAGGVKGEQLPGQLADGAAHACLGASPLLAAQAGEAGGMVAWPHVAAHPV